MGQATLTFLAAIFRIQASPLPLALMTDDNDDWNPTADDLMPRRESYVRDCFHCLGIHNEEVAIMRLTKATAEEVAFEIAIAVVEQEAGFS